MAGFQFVHLLSLIVLGGGGYLLVVGVDTDLRLIISSQVTLVIGYWFGTSDGSKAKNKIITELSQPKEP